MEKESTAPVMDVAAPPKPVEPPKSHEAKPHDKPAPAAKTESKDKAPKAKVEGKVQKQKDNSNVTVAIVATVFIVFGLAALATYAYFKQN